MILAVTLNLALDVTYRVGVLVAGSSIRVRQVEQRAGGKGVNVARVLHALDTPVVVTGFVGGATGALVRGDLAAAGLADDLVEIDGETRRTVAVVDEAGAATLLLEPGPAVTAEGWAALLAKFERLAGRADAVVLSGSLPSGLAADAYAELVARARSLGRAVILDTSGSPLRAALGARPTIVKPNRDELLEATAEAAFAGGTAAAPVAGPDAMPVAGPDAMPVAGPDAMPVAGPDAAPPAGPEPDVDGLVARADCLRAAGADAVVASLGADGMLATAAGGAWHARLPRTVPVNGNPTGAGDAAVAALARGLVEGLAWPERLRDAVALSAAAVLDPLAGGFDAAAYARLTDLVEVRAIARPPGHQEQPCR